MICVQFNFVVSLFKDYANTFFIKNDVIMAP